MAHFESYNTSDPSTGAVPLAGNGTITPIIIETGIDGILVGSMFSDQSGSLVVSQSFDYNVSGPLGAQTATGHWDIVTTIAVTGGTGTAITGLGNSNGIPVLAPYVQIQYTNGATPQTVMRLFVRTFGTKTG